MSIEWTLCSERMPPRTYEEKVILRGYTGEYLMFMSSEDCNLLLPNYDKTNRVKCSWTEFTQEKWEFLNR